MLEGDYNCCLEYIRELQNVVLIPKRLIGVILGILEEFAERVSISSRKI